MGNYINRSIASAILKAKRKVVILEGARAVGKTMMAHRQLVSAGYSYETLANENTYVIAQQNLESWLAGLQTPVIIDEAQRIAELPLAIKEFVDALPSGKVHVVLTGSALINRHGLDGQDPLARRAQHFVMSPMIRQEQLEIAQQNSNIVDLLVDSSPNSGFDFTSMGSELSRSSIAEIIAAGGFPEYSMQYKDLEEWEREQLVESDLRAVLGDTILPDERLDVVIAMNILEKILCTPGGIVNTSMLGEQLALDRRTVERYLSIFLRRFIIHALPNIRTAPNRQVFTRSKLHPVDTSLSVQTLLTKGVDIKEQPVYFGNVLESFVVNQIIPAVQWSKTHPSCFYYREPGNQPKEVDLVLLHRNSIIGIEVKSASRITKQDFRGLQALSKDPRFKQGYVVYCGNRVLQWDEHLWALPLQALWNTAPQQAW